MVHVGVEVNVAAAERFRQSYAEKRGTKISMMNMIQKCAATTGREYPLVCGLFDGDDTLGEIADDMRRTVEQLRRKDPSENDSKAAFSRMFAVTTLKHNLDA